MERLTRRSGNGTGIYNTPSGDPIKWENNRYKVLQKLAEYEDLEEQGKLLKLPINAKTKIYSIEYCCGENKNNKTGMCFRGFCSECERKSYYILEATAESSCKISEIGKTVFLTREEAEVALKKVNE